MSLKIITDSTADLEHEFAASLDVEVVPLRVLFGEESYRDCVDITKEQFYTRLGTVKVLPTTSQVNPDEFSKVFKDFLDAGHTVLGVFLSTGISGTYQSAVIAKEMLDSDKIFLVNSLTATSGLALLVQEAVAMRNRGCEAPEIAEKLTELSSRTRLIAVVGTLKYFKMGGRISASTAIVGEVMGISPFVSIVNGKLEPIGKARGKKAIFSYFEEFVLANPVDENYPIGFLHANCVDAKNDLQSYLTEAGICKENHFTCELGSVLGTHSGPGCYGLAYISK